MKKLVTLLLALVLVLSAVSAVAEADKPLAGKTITFWMQAYGGDPATQSAMLDGLTAAFYEETGITVEYSLVDWGQAQTKWTLAMTGGECPDIADTFFAYSWVALGGEEYGPMNIDDLVAEMGVEGKFYDFAIPECFIGGHWVGLPWRGDTRIGMYNKAMLEEAGIEAFPTTYDELVEVAKKLTTYDANGNVDRAGFLFRQSEARFDQTFFAILAGMGGHVMNEDYTEFTLDTQEVRDALHFMQDCLYEYKVMPDSILDPTHNSTQTYSAEKAAIVLGASPDDMLSIGANAPQLIDVTIGATMPSKTGEGPSSIAFSAPICIFNGTKEPEAAKEFMKFLMRTENLVALNQGTGTISVWEEVMKQPYFDSQWNQAILGQNERAVPGDMPLALFSLVDAFPNGPLNTMCTAVMAGEDVDTALAACIAAVDEIVAENAE